MKNDKEDQKKDKQSKKDHAINIKGDVSDGNETSPQVEQKKDTHQPRDKA